MIRYLKMRFFMLQIKLALFDAFAHGEDYITMFTKLATSAKDMTPDEVRKEFLIEWAGIIHDYVHKDDKQTKESTDK